MNEIKVSINDLATIADYEVYKVDALDAQAVINEFDEIWESQYLNEDLLKHDGEPAYVLRDNVRGSIRGCYITNELDEQTKIELIDNIDNVIFDLIFNDIVDEYIPKDDVLIKNGSLSYDDLLDAVKRNNATISDTEYSWLLVLAKGRLDLLEL